MVPFGLIAVVVSTVNDHLKPHHERNTAASSDFTDGDTEGTPIQESPARTVTWCYPLLDDYDGRELRHRNERKSYCSTPPRKHRPEGGVDWNAVGKFTMGE